VIGLCTCGNRVFHRLADTVFFEKGVPTPVWPGAIIYECAACGATYRHEDAGAWLPTSAAEPTLLDMSARIADATRAAIKDTEYEFYSAVMQASGASLEEVQRELAKTAAGDVSSQ